MGQSDGVFPSDQSDASISAKLTPCKPQPTLVDILPVHLPSHPQPLSSWSDGALTVTKSFDFASTPLPQPTFVLHLVFVPGSLPCPSPFHSAPPSPAEFGCCHCTRLRILLTLSGHFFLNRCLDILSVGTTFLYGAVTDAKKPIDKESESWIG